MKKEFFDSSNERDQYEKRRVRERQKEESKNANVSSGSKPYYHISIFNMSSIFNSNKLSLLLMNS